jgi:hypothetical protein
MSTTIRVCLWATTIQANIYSLARYLAAHRDRFEPIVVLPDLKQYEQEPIWSLGRPDCLMLDHDAPDCLDRIEALRPQVTVVDNHYPPRKLSPSLLNVWHGFGWKGPEDKQQFADVYAHIERLTGISPDKPNPYLRWITAGPTNLTHRIRVTGFHPSNVEALGQAYVDDVGNVPWSRESLLTYYPAEFQHKRIALFAPTWHFGRIFAHWGADLTILGRLFSFLAERNTALIMRMHDRARFEPDYLSALESLAARYPNVLLKYKDRNQDNLIDLTVSDLMISNYSSILTYFYGTGKPSIHIEPVDRSAQASVYRYWKRGKVRTTRTADKSYIWSLDPNENGGLVAESVEDLLACIEKALENPDCCIERSKAFIARHCAPYDGKNCERIANAIVELAGYAEQHPPSERSGLGTVLRNAVAGRFRRRVSNGG